MPSVTLTVRDNVGAGRLDGHPGQVEVRTWRTPDNGLAVSLWDCGKFRIGEGLLHARNGQWVGRCSEYAGWWDVSGSVGSRRLVFAEPGE